MEWCRKGSGLLSHPNLRTIDTGNGLASASSKRMRGLGACGCQPEESIRVLIRRTEGLHTPSPLRCSALTAASPGGGAEGSGCHQPTGSL